MDVSRAAQRATEPAAVLPSGIVTFLFTDIEGSTQMLERHRAAAGPALARHHDLLRTAIEQTHGVVFETVGDAVYASFARPADAIAAAVAIQRALATEDWGEIGDLRARIAIHTGAVESRGRHYFGPALFETARLQSLAHGRQTLTSAATSALAAADLTDGITLRAMGTHRLKDLLEPLDVYQVVAPGLPDRFPPLRAAIQAPTNLATDPTAFIGRVADLAALEALLDEHRFVTLVGPGGTGKTRLAVESGLRRLSGFPDGAWIAELAPITDPDVVSPAIADVWNLRAINRSDLDGVIDRHLASRRLLLIIDNCEHLLGAVAPMVERMMRASPGLSVIATSREPLGIAGETVYRVPSLSLPHEADDPTSSESVRLFVDRARLVRPDFAPGDELDAVLQICRRVDGMPLALELAAARLRTLSPAELADRLERSFHILTGGSRTALPRQRTLDATIDWSHEMLSERERSVFRRVAAFAGGFDIPAAEAVCSSGGVDAGEVLDVLDSLVLKSLVLTIHGPSSRFRMLEPIRQYAQEVLAASGEAGETRRAHAHHYAALVADASPGTRGPEQMAWDRRLDVDYDNIRAALVTLREQGDLDRYLDLTFDLFAYWMHTGRHLDGIETAVAGVEAAPETTDPARLVKAWWTAASLGSEITRPQSIEHARAGLAVAERTGDPNLIGRMRLQLGASIRHATNDPAYLEHLHEGRRLVLDEHPEPYWWEPAWERGFLHFICFAYLPADDRRIREHQAAAMAAFDAVGDRVLAAATLVEASGLFGVDENAVILEQVDRAATMLAEMHVPYWYGHAVMIQGILRKFTDSSDSDATIEILGRGVDLLEEIGDLFCWAQTSRALAGSEVEIGQTEVARRRLAEIIRRMPQLPMPEVSKPRTLDVAVQVLIAMGELREAARVFGFARAAELPTPSAPRAKSHLALHETLQSQLGSEELELLMAQGSTLDADELLARSLRRLAEPAE